MFNKTYYPLVYVFTDIALYASVCSFEMAQLSKWLVFILISSFNFNSFHPNHFFLHIFLISIFLLFPPDFDQFFTFTLVPFLFFRNYFFFVQAVPRGKWPIEIFKLISRKTDLNRVYLIVLNDLTKRKISLFTKISIINLFDCAKNSEHMSVCGEIAVAIFNYAISFIQQFHFVSFNLLIKTRETNRKISSSGNFLNWKWKVKWEQLHSWKIY